MPHDPIKTKNRLVMVKEYWQKNAIMPTYRTMMGMFKCTSTNSPYQFTQRMIKLGIFGKVGSRITPGPKFFE